MSGIGLVALPADLVFGLGLAQLVLFMLHQVQCVLLHGSVSHSLILVMWADDVQVVIQPHMYCVVLIPEPGHAQTGRKQGGSEARPVLSLQMFTCPLYFILLPLKVF